MKPKTHILPVRLSFYLVGCPCFHRRGSLTAMRPLYHGAATQFIRCGSYVYVANGSRLLETILNKSY